MPKVEDIRRQRRLQLSMVQDTRPKTKPKPEDFKQMRQINWTVALIKLFNNLSDEDKVIYQQRRDTYPKSLKKILKEEGYYEQSNQGN